MRTELVIIGIVMFILEMIGSVIILTHWTPELISNVI
jgi:hypothetical protein